MGGKANLVDFLIHRKGYSRKKAKRLVDSLIGIIKEKLIEGKNVELEGIGLLKVYERGPIRRIAGYVAGSKPMIKSISTKYKQRKTVRLIKGRWLDKE